MSSRPKTQESLQKQKSASQMGDLRNRSISNPPAKQLEKAVAEISMKDFLDFLKISYQVNEAIDNSSPDISEKACVDWRKLTADVLINRLKEREAALCKEKNEKLKLDSPVKGQEKPENDSLENISCESDKETCGTPAAVDAGASDAVIKNQRTEENVKEKASSSEKVSEPHSPLERLSSTLSLDRKIISDKIKRPYFGRKKVHSLKKEGSVESETSRSLDGVVDDKAPARALKKKLNEVLQEGILDSVLPYMLPKQQQQQPQTNSLTASKRLSSNEAKRLGSLEKSEKSFAYSGKEKSEIRRKSLISNDLGSKFEKKDLEVVIHVCDEIKNLKRDFKCSQKLLISQMGYFAEVTAGQRLEDMDISVHCDVTIFDWLMRWVQKDKYAEEHWPVLDSSIVIPVLMSSAFLQMDSLQDHCLQYCKHHINDIVRDSPNLSCVNDNVLTRLANLFSNSEIENIKDKKDKIQSKLFCKLIAALTEPEPQPMKGHYSSVATIYRCAKCLKLILKNISGSILCVASNMTMDRNGQVHSTHVYDSSWNLSDFVRDLKVNLKTWRRVYWRLWAECHLLYCTACEEYFPLHHMKWCRYHEESVQYFPLENHRSTSYPIGRYSCCGERAYRFETVKKITGCQYRDHVTTPRTMAEREILRIWNTHKDVIKDEPPPLLPPERIKFIKPSRDEGGDRRSPIKDAHWWEGLELVPSKQQAGLLNKIWDTVIKKDDSKSGNTSENKTQKSPIPKILTTVQPNVHEASSFSDSSDESSSSSNAGNSEESSHSTAKVGVKSKTFSSSHYFASSRNEGNRFWVSKLSTRCNQDNQREFEERAIRQIESLLAKKFSGENFRTAGNRSVYQIIPPGGTYVKLEQEWREAHCFSHGCPGSSIKARGSASYVNVNNSSFSIQKRSKSRGHR